MTGCAAPNSSIKVTAGSQDVLEWEESAVSARARLAITRVDSFVNFCVTSRFELQTWCSILKIRAEVRSHDKWDGVHSPRVPDTSQQLTVYDRYLQSATGSLVL